MLNHKLNQRREEVNYWHPIQSKILNILSRELFVRLKSRDYWLSQSQNSPPTCLRLHYPCWWPLVVVVVHLLIPSQVWHYYYLGRVVTRWPVCGVSTGVSEPGEHASCHGWDTLSWQDMIPEWTVDSQWSGSGQYIAPETAAEGGTLTQLSTTLL